MDRSQLRLLALEYAKSDLEEADYRKRRGRLIDDIVNGEIEIIRQATPRLESRPAPPALQNKPALKPIYVAVGLVVLVALIWAVYPSKPLVPSPVPILPPPTDPTPAPAITRAPGPGELLIEEFLLSNSWTERNVSEFESAWRALTEIERSETHASGIFEQLSDALMGELNAQYALAALDGSSEAFDSGDRIHLFGEFLELGSSLPARRQALIVGDAETDIQPIEPESVKPEPEPEPESELEPKPEAAIDADETRPIDTAQAFDDNLTAATIVSTQAPSSPASSDNISAGHEWLHAQDAGRYTLQLFALSTIEYVDSVLSKHRQIALRSIKLPQSAPAYRILYGSFTDEQSANAAYIALPNTLTQGQSKPIIRSIAELRAVLSEGQLSFPARPHGLTVIVQLREHEIPYAFPTGNSRATRRPREHSIHVAHPAAPGANNPTITL